MASGTARPARLGQLPAGSGNANGEVPRQSGPLSQNFANGGASWNNGIWGNAALKSTYGKNANGTNRSREENTYPDPNSTASIEGKAGSSSLVPSSESDAWGMMDAQISDVGTSPLRHRNSNQRPPTASSTEAPQATSPYFQVARQAPIGAAPTMLSKSPNKQSLDLASSNLTASRPTDKSYGLSGHARPFQVTDTNEDDQGYAPSSTSFGGQLDEMLFQGNTGIRRSDGFMSQRPDPAQGLGGQFGTQRDRNLPSHQMPRSNGSFSTHRTSHSAQSSAFSSHSQSYKQGDSGRQMQHADLTAGLERLSMTPEGGSNSHAEGGASSMNGVQLPWNPDLNFEYWRRQMPANINQQQWGTEEAAYSTGVGSFTPEGYPDEPFAEQFNAFRLARTDDRQPAGFAGNNRRSHQSPYYSAGGTPPAGSDQFRASSRGSMASRTPAKGHSAMLDQKLRGLQQEQQGYLTPPMNPLMMRSENFRGQFTPNAYDYNPNDGFRVNAIGSFPHVAGVSHVPMTSRGPSRDHDVGHNLRSPLLEEFRSNAKTSKRYELKDIFNHVVEFSGDQHGSRFIQQKLETANSDEKDQVFREIKPNALPLMTDVFGNYVIQKFFEHGTQQQKTLLADMMKGQVLNLSVQMYGCRVVQKALEHVLVEQQAALVKELEAHVLKCVKDQNGNHVIQKAIERVRPEHIQFIINAFTGQVQSLATHPYGCRVIQRMLEHCTGQAQTSLLEELHACTHSLIVDQYGNYVTQHVIEHGMDEDRAKIISLITGQLVYFSKHKFASNVVEKSIQFGSDEQRREITAILTEIPSNGSSLLPSLIRDQYGNYVIQKLLGQMKGADLERLVEQIRTQLASLKKFTYGKQITAIEKLIYVSGVPPPSTTPPPDSSAGPTPPLSNTAAHSPQSSSLPSTNTSTVDGPVKSADVSEKVAETSEGLAITTTS